MRSDPAGAQAHVSAATLLVRTDCDAKALSAALAVDMTKLLKERYNGDDPVTAPPRGPDACHKSRDAAIAAGRPPSIAQRVVLLELNCAAVGSQPLADLLILEKEFYIAEVWTNIIEIKLKNADEETQGRLKPVLQPLLAQLETAPHAAHTQLLIALVKSTLSPADIEAALKAKAARIDCNPYARYLDLERFHFCFLSPVLSAVPATRQLPNYQWEFDDHTTPPDDGDRCKHFFWAPRRWERLWWWLIDQSERTRTVKVTLPAMSTETFTFTRDIKMQLQKDRASSLGAMQIITFFVTTGMAVLASFGAQYSGVLPASIDWGPSVTALLFGFGIDQIRDRAATK